MPSQATSQQINSFVSALDRIDNVSGSAVYFMRVAERLNIPQALPGPVRGLVMLADMVGVNGAYAGAFSAAIRNEDYALATQIVLNRYGCKALALGASTVASSAVLAAAAPGATAAYVVPPAGLAATGATAIAAIGAGVVAYNATENTCSALVDSAMHNSAFRNNFNSRMRTAIAAESGMFDWLQDSYQEARRNVGRALDPRSWMRTDPMREDSDRYFNR